MHLHMPRVTGTLTRDSHRLKDEGDGRRSCHSLRERTAVYQLVLPILGHYPNRKFLQQSSGNLSPTALELLARLIDLMTAAMQEDAYSTEQYEKHPGTLIHRPMGHKDTAACIRCACSMQEV